MLEKQIKQNKKIMTPEQANNSNQDILDEYLFDYSKGKPNRFADKLNTDHLLVSIDNDLSLLFNNEEKVNSALRSYLSIVESNQVIKSI